jgi:TRAP-type uncharacterized transport system substrate-binding protein
MRSAERPYTIPSARRCHHFGRADAEPAATVNLEIKDMVPSEAVMPIHPGALNYYREAGLVH